MKKTKSILASGANTARAAPHPTTRHAARLTALAGLFLNVALGVGAGSALVAQNAWAGDDKDKPGQTYSTPTVSAPAVNPNSAANNWGYSWDYKGQFGKNGEPLGINGIADQLHINAITDPDSRASMQWRYDRAKSYITQADGIERSTDKDKNGRIREHFTPAAMTTMDCSVGRHWELLGGIAGCVCDGDLTHRRVGNNEPAACLGVPTGSPVASPAPAPVPIATIVNAVCVDSARITTFSTGVKAIQDPSSLCPVDPSIPLPPTVRTLVAVPANPPAPTPPPPGETFGGQGCDGYNLMNWYSPTARQVLAQANSPTCGWTPPVAAVPPPAPGVPPAPAPVAVTWAGNFCTGPTLISWFSDGHQEVAEYESPSCPWTPPIVVVPPSTPPAVAVAPPPAPAPVAVTWAGYFCNATTLTSYYSDGHQEVAEANSASCGWTPPPVAVAPPPAPPVPIPEVPPETVGGSFCYGNDLIYWYTPSGRQELGVAGACYVPPSIVAVSPYMVCGELMYTTYSWSDGSTTVDWNPTPGAGCSDSQ